ncbi:MAG: homoserine kinase [Armatimonadetes bacterium]|nr:homoserine kinase [Armatimonadota bacterium]
MTTLPSYCRVRVPGTAANLGPGFDAVGLAVAVHNTLEISRSATPRVVVTGEGAGTLSGDASNLMYHAAREVARATGHADVSFQILCENRLPIGRGLGSSAAAIVGGLLGANRLLGSPLSQTQIAHMAVALEGHPDNVIPALVGGVTIASMNGTGAHWIRLTPARMPRVVIAVPGVALATETARGVLPRAVEFPDAVFNVGKAALFVAAIAESRFDLLRAAMEDRLHQPYRKALVPGFDDVVAAAKGAGAYGAALSGAGSSVLALCEDRRAAAVGGAMRDAFARHAVEARIVETDVDPKGAHVVCSA